MEWKDIQPIATMIGAITAAIISAITLWKLQSKKRNDDIDLKSFQHSLDIRLKEFESTLAQTNSYLAEKGRNDATKEDIEKITRKVESIRNEFTTTSEFLRWQLSKKANLHKLQAEKEFEVYSKIWERAIDLKSAFEQLRPIVDFYDSSIPATERWNSRYSRCIESGRNLFQEVEKLRPFYPEELFLQLHKLLQKSNEEIVNFEYSLDPQKEKMSHEGYKKEKENLDEIIDSLNSVCNLMCRYQPDCFNENHPKKVSKAKLLDKFIFT